MRLGGPVFGSRDTPEGWVQAVQAKGYRAAGCPLSPDADDDAVTAYRNAAETADIVIAEVGAWSNPLSPDAEERRDLAERIGARCCVNVAGSRGPQWDGPDPRDLTDETFEMIVASVREIVDAVKPTATHYTIEAMPWMYPDSADSYLRLLKAVDRKEVAVHLDPVNMVNSPERFFRNADLICECFAKLGPRIVSCHAKDISLDTRPTVHLDEVRPGTGGLDYGVFLDELNRLDPISRSCWSICRTKRSTTWRPSTSGRWLPKKGSRFNVTPQIGLTCRTSIARRKPLSTGPDVDVR